MRSAQREHPEARKELRAAANGFDDPAIGQKFVDATRVARQAITHMPAAWPPVRGFEYGPTVRRKSVGGFPYGILYCLTATEIVILAYAHERWRPGYWEDRIDG